MMVTKRDSCGRSGVCLKSARIGGSRCTIRRMSNEPCTWKDVIMTGILRIEDDDQLRGMLRHALEHEGYGVTATGDGCEGSRHHRAAPTDLIIMNLLLPGQEGLRTIRKLRQAFPALRILAISGGGSTGALTLLHIPEEFGASRLLAKLFTLERFLAVVHEILVQQALSGWPRNMVSARR
jgi:two-component system, chemotaxis family, chemotaxis protein CheY